MHICTKIAPSDTPNKKRTQHKKHPLIPFENNGTLKKYHMANFSPRYDTHKKYCRTKLTQFVKKCPEVFIARAEPRDF